MNTASAGEHAGIELRLYLDSTSLSVVHQMADFVACEGRPEILKVITWLRCPLNAAQLKDSNSLYLGQKATVTPNFVAAIAQLVSRHGVRRLTLHSNHHHAHKAVLPVLRALLGQRLLDAEQIELHLYDDGSLSLIEREQMLRDHRLGEALQTEAMLLRRALLDDAAPAWTRKATYAWHALFKTRYHMLRPDLLLDAPGAAALDDGFRAAIRTMRFDHAQTLGPTGWARYLGLYGLDAESRAALRDFTQAPDSFVFVGASVREKPENARLGELQLNSMAALRQQGLLPASGRLGFKGHPANRDHEQALMAALGPDTFRVPARLPLEVMMMDGLLPAGLGGTASSSFLTLPADRLRFVLCDAQTQEASLALPYTRILLNLGIVTPERVFPYLKPAKPAAEVRVADLEAAHAQLVAAIGDLVDNIVQLRNEDVRALDERTQKQAAQIKALQTTLNLERSNRDLTEVSRMHPKQRIVVFTGTDRKHIRPRIEALQAQCWFLPGDAEQAEEIAQAGGHCFPADADDWTAAHLHTALAAAVAVHDDELPGRNPYAAALLAGARRVRERPAEQPALHTLAPDAVTALLSRLAPSPEDDMPLIARIAQALPSRPGAPT